MRREVNNGNKFSTHLHQTKASDVKATETEELQKAVAEEMLQEDSKEDFDKLVQDNTLTSVENGEDGEEEKTPEDNS